MITEQGFEPPFWL